MRKLIFILFVIVVILLLAGAAVRVVLSSDIPRKQTEKSLREKLGIKVSIKEMETSFSGKTTLTGVGFQLPSKRTYLLHLDYIRVRHNNLFDVLVSGLRPSYFYARGATVRSFPCGAGNGIDVFSARHARVEAEFDRNASGDKERSSRLSIKLPNLADIEAFGSVEENLIDVAEIDGTLLGGGFTGRAAVDVNQWHETRVNARWTDVDLRELRKWWPGTEQTLGLWSGRIEVKPSEPNHPLEPLAFEGNMDIKGGLCADLDMKQVRLSGAIGSRRILLTDLEVPALGGLVRANARLSKKADELFFYTNWNLANIDVNEVTAALSKEEKYIVGRASGKGYFMTSLDADDMSGKLKLTLKESDLASTRIIGTLYNAMNLKVGKPEPEGQGDAEIRFDGTKLRISDFYYFNRGVEVRGTGLIEDLGEGKKSPVEGVVLATTRPLKDVDLPGLSVVDKFLYLAQRDMTAVKVEGALDDVQVKVVTFPEIRSTLGRLLGAGSD